MRRLLSLICLCWIAGAAPALAASGNGLYEPYPAGVGDAGAQVYYATLGRTVSAAQLDQGAFTGAMRASPSANGPSSRAGVASPGPGVWELAVVGAITLAVAVACALRARWA